MDNQQSSLLFIKRYFMYGQHIPLPGSPSNRTAKACPKFHKSCSIPNFLPTDLVLWSGTLTVRTLVRLKPVSLYADFIHGLLSRGPRLPPLAYLHQCPQLPPNPTPQHPPGLGHVPDITSLLFFPCRRPLCIWRTYLHHR